MAIALVSSVLGPATPAAAGGATAAIDTTGADLLIMVVGANVLPTATPTDSKGNTWTGLTGVTHSRIYYCKPTSVGTGHTFTFSQADSYPIINVFAFSGSAEDPYDDDENGATGYTGGGPDQPGSITPPEDGCVVVTGVAYTGAITNIACTGFTTESSAAVANRVAGGGAYLVQTPAAAINPSWTHTGDATCGRTVAAFLPAASAPTVTVQPSAASGCVEPSATATFTSTATGTGTVDATTEIETGVGSDSYATLANGNGATWTGLTGTGSGSATATPIGTFSATTLTGRRIRIKFEDDNGTTYSNAVALTIGTVALVQPDVTDAAGEPDPSAGSVAMTYVTPAGVVLRLALAVDGIELGTTSVVGETP